MNNNMPQNDFRITGGKSEAGVVVGNTFDKYNSRNPIVRWMMRGFAADLNALVKKAAPKSIYEAGCGEGFWVLQWNAQGIAAQGSDFSRKAIDIARANARQRGFSEDIFHVHDIYELSVEQNIADLVVCCEVLEHLEEPEKALQTLATVAQEYVLLSVPREPLWCLLNMARGKYWNAFGNTPGHIQHWNTRTFLEMVERYFSIVEIRKPLPWVMVLAKSV